MLTTPFVYIGEQLAPVRLSVLLAGYRRWTLNQDKEATCMHACMHRYTCTAVHTDLALKSTADIQQQQKTVTRRPSSSSADLLAEGLSRNAKPNQPHPPPPRVHSPGRSVPSTAVALFCPSAGFLSSVLAWRASRGPTRESSVNLRSALAGPIDGSRRCQLSRGIRFLYSQEGLLYARYI